MTKGDDLTNVQFSMLNSYPMRNWKFGIEHWSDLTEPKEKAAYL